MRLFRTEGSIRQGIQLGADHPEIPCVRLSHSSSNKRSGPITGYSVVFGENVSLNDDLP
jgi:hypothetical protein